jgi:phosphoserine/homoserine phosphotransferase
MVANSSYMPKYRSASIKLYSRYKQRSALRAGGRAAKVRPNFIANEEYPVEIACLDLEGVLVPEIWIAFAEKTGIESLKATTRDIPDYDVLMQQRLRILDEHGLKLADIQAVIATLKPLDGAVEFVNWLRERFQVVILSDTFYEFSQPLMRQLGFPALLCHKLITDENDRVVSYQLRQKDPKRQSVLAFKSLYYRVIAAGDSYNDTTMLSEAHAGILFHAPENVIREFPQFPAVHTFAELKQEFLKASERDLSL